MAARRPRAGRSRRELGKDVALIGAQRQRSCPPHRGERQCTVKMGKQIAAARNLPFQRAFERIGIDRHQHQVGGGGEMLRRGLADLGGGREMNEAITLIDAGAAEQAATLRLAPKRFLADLVNGRRHGAPDSAVRYGFSDYRAWRNTSTELTITCLYLLLSHRLLDGQRL